MLDRQLIGRFVILRVLRQAAFQLGSVRQIRRLAQEGDLRLGPGQGSLVVVALDRVEHGLGFTQLTALGQAACIEDQGGGVGIVLAQQLHQQRFGLADAPFAEQRLSLLQWVRRSRRWHLHMGLQHRPHGRLRLCTGKAVHRLAILEQHHRRQALNAKTRHDVLFGFAVDLGQQQLTLITLGNLRQHWHQCFAGCAPLGPEIDQYGLFEGVLDNGLIEVGGGDVEDVRRGLTHGASRIKREWGQL